MKKFISLFMLVFVLFSVVPVNAQLDYTPIDIHVYHDKDYSGGKSLTEPWIEFDERKPLYMEEVIKIDGFCDRSNPDRVLFQVIDHDTNTFLQARNGYCYWFTIVDLDSDLGVTFDYFFESEVSKDPFRVNLPAQYAYTYMPIVNR